MSTSTSQHKLLGICYSRMRRPPECSWQTESPSCGCHGASCPQTFWTKCHCSLPANQPTEQKEFGRDWNNYSVLLLVLLKVPLTSSCLVSQKRDRSLLGVAAAFSLHCLYPGNFRGAYPAKLNALPFSKHSFQDKVIQGKVSFYLWKFSSDFTNEVLRTRFLRMLWRLKISADELQDFLLPIYGWFVNSLSF